MTVSATASRRSSSSDDSRADGGDVVVGLPVTESRSRWSESRCGGPRHSLASARAAAEPDSLSDAVRPRARSRGGCQWGPRAGGTVTVTADSDSEGHGP
eukprot:2838670-Rhodomonas_salina.1